MKNLFLILILPIILLSYCSKEEKVQVCIDTSVDLSVKDAKGNDLLNPNNPKAFNQDSIDIIHVKNGEETVFFQWNLDAQRGFMVFQHENEYRMRVHIYRDKNEVYPIRYIRWNSKDADTLKCQIRKRGSVTNIKKIWLNGKLVWQFESATPEFIKIVKK